MSPPTPGSSAKGHEVRYPDLVSEIRKSGPAPVTLLKVARESAFLLADDLALLTAESFLGPGRKPERIRGGDDGASDRIASLGNLSLFDERRVVLLTSPGDLAVEAWIELERLLERPMEGIRLLLVSEGTGPPGPKRGRGKAGGAAFEERVRRAGGSVATLWPPFANQLPGWIVRRGTSLGIEIPLEVAEAILERVGPDLRDLANELEKLRLAIGDRSSVRREDLAVVARGLPDEAAFAFLDAIDTRDSRRIASALETALTLDREAIALTALVGGHFIRLLTAQDARVAGVPTGQLASRLGMPSWRLAPLQAAEARYDRDTLIDLIVETARIDAKLKTGSGSPAALFTLLASRMARGAGVSGDRNA